MYSYNKNGVYIHDNKFIFNGKNLSDLVVVERVYRSLLPHIMNEGIYIAGRKGQLMTRQLVDNRLVQVDVRILDKDYNKTALELAQALYSDKPYKLELYDSELHNYAMVTSSTDLIEDNKTVGVRLIFECSDVYNYGEKVEKPINESFMNISFSTVGIISCKTNETSSVIVRNRDKTYLTINHAFKANQDLVIDLEKRLITLNGVSIMKYLTLSSNFFEIDNGINKIDITGVSSGKVEYKERWI